MDRESLPYLTKQGLYALSIGFYLKDGKRTQKKFRLGRDRSAAIRMARALRAAWDEETTSDNEGKKVWSEESIQRALAFADNKTVSTPTAPPAIRPSSRTPVPVFAPDPPPKPTPAFYTLPQALDEFGTFFSERTDIGEKHREVIASRLKSIKVHIEDIFWATNGTKIWLKDLPVGQIDLEWLNRIRNKITSRPLSQFRPACSVDPDKSHTTARFIPVRASDDGAVRRDLNLVCPVLHPIAKPIRSPIAAKAVAHPTGSVSARGRFQFLGQHRAKESSRD